MTITFIHPHKAFLPEIEAYKKIFSRQGITTTIAQPGDVDKIKSNVEWHFMGTDNNKKNNAIKIHEYTSASVPPFGKGKNLSKKILNVKPDFRLFLNKYVEEQFNFKDQIPFGYRDMGVDLSFLEINQQNKKEFDFIYTGSIDKERKIERLTACFTTGNMKHHSLMILSKDYEEIKNKLKEFKNIFFAGPVAHEEVKNYILKSRFALNFILDKEPFNQQTSTKFLEYAALKTPIVSTEYAWIKSFQQHYGGKYFYVKNDLSNFNWNSINNYNYSFPDLSEWTWEKQIRKSGVLEFLQSKFSGLSF
jgi:glycosyltransferase involved in cell wall biosynthesis